MAPRQQKGTKYIEVRLSAPEQTDRRQISTDFVYHLKAKAQFYADEKERVSPCRSLTREGQWVAPANSEHDPPPGKIKLTNGAVLYIGKCLGTGGYSCCYLAGTASGKTYAAKTIARNTVKTASMQAHIDKEVRILRKLHHPNVVNFVRFIETRTHFFLVMDLCPYGTLHEFLAHCGRFRDEEARELLSPLFEGVHYLHSQLIHHGDLKLGNILMDGKLNFRIGDFGLSKQLKLPNEKRTSMCGTTAYMAPEIIKKPCVFGLPADIWSLGIIAYTLLYGVTAFDAKDADSVYARIRAYDLKFPEVDPPVSTGMIGLLRLMLHPDPKCRPTSRALVYNNRRRAGSLSHKGAVSTANAERGESVTPLHTRVEAISSRLKHSAARKTGYLKSVIAAKLGKTEVRLEQLLKPS